jgi:enoyl-CoA hydratase/carnithine racemase
MAYSKILYELKDGIATVRLNDPARLNALTFESYRELEALMAELGQNQAAKVVVLTGEGRGFCSGGSVTEIIGKLLEMDHEGRLRFTRMTCNLVRNMRRLRIPIIAAVNGIAAGAGAVLALASDIRIAAAGAKFAFLFAKVGLSGADMGALYLLPRIVGEGRALELLLSGETIGAEEAHRIGLVSRVVADDRLMEESYALARRLKEGPLFAMGLTKILLGLERELSFEAALELEASVQADCMGHEDFREGYLAFLERRPPRFNRQARG